ncbi:hypothetical protein GZH53_04750 [Flavihumibacter sp. R14]|nr:hypothetical protein [Flavihumibacter soli]
MKVSSAGPGKQQEVTRSEIKIDSARQSKLDFSLADGNFDKVYGNVHNGFQDKARNLWFGTTGAGTIRYDGKVFTHFSAKDKLNNNSLTPLLEDKLGNIWFGTADGLYRYDTKTFTRIPIADTERNNVQSFIGNTSRKRNGGSVSFISAMQDKRGNIWFGTELNGVYCYDGKTLTNILSKKGIINTSGLRLNAIISIVEDRNGIIWFASWNNEGLVRYEGNSLISYTQKVGLGDNMIYSLLEDEAGNIWIGTRDHGVWRYDGKSFTNISEQTDLKDEAIYSIEKDKNGNIWFSTQSKGVWRFDGKSFANFTTKDGLVNNSVFCIVKENNGNLWFGTRGMGLCRYDGKTFTDFTKNNH